MSASADDGRIVCQIDNVRVHVIKHHLRDHHPDWTVERYAAQYPHAPLLSEKAKELVAKAKEKEKERASDAPSRDETVASSNTRRTFKEVFGLGVEVTNNRGEPLTIEVHGGHDADAEMFIPAVDENYVFDIEATRTALMGMALRMPILFWGYHGTGKTTLLQQICARVRRPFMRVQHTIGTEESHIVGQYVVKEGETRFQPGPLMMALQHGYVYCADEYDFAMPSVLSVYQPVLEGAALVVG
jgi:cobaltochelatase CobS